MDVFVPRAVGLVVPAQAGCSEAGLAGAASGVRRVSVIAHRGASERAPENTLRAFELAAAMGADFIELDVAETSDGRLVCLHDATLERTTTGRGPIAAATLAEVTALDAGSWKHPRFAGERVPSLREALAQAAGAGVGVYIEIRRAGVGAEAAIERRLVARLGRMIGNRHRLDQATRAAVLAAIRTSGCASARVASRVMAEVADARMVAGVVIQSFSVLACAVAKLTRPALRVELLAASILPTLLGPDAAVEWVVALDLDGLNLNPHAITEQRLAAVHRSGGTVGAWTVNDVPTLRELVAKGVDRVITDKPDVIGRALDRLGLTGLGAVAPGRAG